MAEITKEGYFKVARSLIPEITEEELEEDWKTILKERASERGADLAKRPEQE